MESSRIFFTRFKYFIWTPRISKYLQEFSWNFWDFENIFFMNQKIYLDFSRFILSLKIYSERLKSFLFSSRSFNMFCPHQVSNALIFHLDQITPETILSRFQCFPAIFRWHHRQFRWSAPSLWNTSCISIPLSHHSLPRPSAVVVSNFCTIV